MASATPPLQYHFSVRGCFFMNTKRKLFGTMVMMGPMLFGPNAAQADDDKIYMASYCRVLSGTVSVAADGAITNTGTGVATVQCPIVRDETLNSLEFVGVRIRDLNTAADFSCVIRRLSTTGSSMDSPLFMTPNDGFTGASVEQIQMFINSSVPPNPVVPSFDPGDSAAIMLQCRIPAAGPAGQSRLFSYVVSENN